MFLFVDVALRAASILEMHDFLLCLCCPAGGLDFEKSCFFILYNFLHIAKLPNLLGFEPREYARTLSLKNAVECTSQRLKRTSGARVMIVFDEH